MKCGKAKEMEKQKQQKYNEMLEMLKICKQTTNSKQIYDEIEQLIKSAREL
jgi:nucleosome binding factor SPN SPT16 subunit